MKEQDQTSDQSVGVADEKVTASIRSRAHSMTHRNTLSERAGAAKANTSDSSPTRYSFTLRECRSPIGKIFFFSFFDLHAHYTNATAGFPGENDWSDWPTPRKPRSTSPTIPRVSLQGGWGAGMWGRESGFGWESRQKSGCTVASKPHAMSPNPPLPHRETTGSPGCNSQPTDLNSGSVGGAINIWEIIIVVCEMFDLKSPYR
jgi:hypothetical protein